jgi:hypothetical protein
VKDEFEPVSAPSLVMLEKQFHQCALRKNQDSDICMIEFGGFVYAD